MMFAISKYKNKMNLFKIIFLSLIIILSGLLTTKTVKASTCGLTSDSVDYACFYLPDNTLKCDLSLTDLAGKYRCDNFVDYACCKPIIPASSYSCGTTMESFVFTCVTNMVANLNNYQCLSLKDSTNTFRFPPLDQQCCLVGSFNGTGPSNPGSGSQNQDTGKTIPNPIGTTDVKVLIGRIINTVLGIVGSLALALFIYGGLTFMTAGGKPEQIQKGKDTLIWAVMGLAVIFTSYVILNFVFQTLVKINS